MDEQFSEDRPSLTRQLIDNEARCKVARTCPRLEVRELFFEPNPFTIEAWRRNHGFYVQGIDRRVVFVCESPSDRRDRNDAADFEIAGQRGWVCWNYTAQDRRFREARVRHGFQDCLVTNAVKCGRPTPSTPAELTDEEAENCSAHLIAELTAVRPIVVACLGDSAFRIAVLRVLPRLAFAPLPVLLSHYSYRGKLETLRQRWDREFGVTKTALEARGLSQDTPLVLPVS